MVRVITVYAAAAFVILELVSIIADPLKLPDWTLAFIIVLLVVGFVIAVIFSWIYDVTPEGIEKTSTARKTGKELTEKPTRVITWKIATYISVVIILVLLAVHIFGGNRDSNNLPELEKSIAVLPFRNDSPDTLNQYFIDGTMESILINLCKIDELSVIARTSVEEYRGVARNIMEIGNALNVSYILEGSGQKYGNKIRLTVQLIDAMNGDHLWSEQYDREIEDIFSIQSEIAQKIADEIHAKIKPEVWDRIAKKPTENPEAYNLYLQGWQYYSQGRRLDKSIEYYEKALEVDPKFALAYVGIAKSLNSYALSGITSRDKVMYRAKDAAIKALELDNTLAEAHGELAYSKLLQDWDFTGAEKGFKQALELNPNNAGVHFRYGRLLIWTLRFDEALRELNLARRLNPQWVGAWIEVGRCYYWSRDYDRAIEEYRKILQVYPESESTHAQLALALSKKGLHDEAVAEVSGLKNKDAWYYFYTGYVYGSAGDTEKAT